MEDIELRARSALVVLMIASMACVLGGCSRTGEQTAPVNAKSRSQNSNQESQALPLYVAESARGDVERAGLAIESALDSARQNKLQQAIDALETAARHLAKTTNADRPDQDKAIRLKEYIEEIKASIDAALNSARSGSDDTKVRIEHVRDGIGALKVRMAQS